MYRVHHGLQGFTDAPTMQDALRAVEVMLCAGLTNVVITRAGVDIDGKTDYSDWHDGRVGTLELNIPILP